MAQTGTNLKECKDCKANGVTTMVLWMTNPETGRRMPADYDTLLKTGQHVRHNCPYWKPGTSTVPQQQTQRPQVAVRGQATLPLPPVPQPPHSQALKIEIEPNSHTDKIFTNLVLALQSVADGLDISNQYLRLLANEKVVEKKVGVQSAFKMTQGQGQAQGQESAVQEADEEEQEEQDEFPGEEQLEEIDTGTRPRQQKERDPDAFPPI